MEKLKLHIGCGTLYKENWINIDNNSDNNIEKLDINHDLSTGLPFENESVDYIYNEHFIEHLSREDGFNFMQECHRVLKIGGVLRISCPDLDSIVDGYIHDTWRKQEWVEKYNYDWIESGCQMVNLNLNQVPWGHKYVYNKTELTKQLEKAGFNADNIIQESFLHSTHVEFSKVDTRIDGMFFEATKTTKALTQELKVVPTHAAFIQLFIEIENITSEENSIKLPVLKNSEIQKFVFELSKYKNITNLRLDPINDSCVIEIEKLSLMKHDGTELDLALDVVADVCFHHGKSYFFDSHDPQVYFDGMSINELIDVKSLVAKIRFAHIGKDALHVSVKQTKTELDQTKTELDQTKTELDQTKTELDQVYASKSYRITKPLRKIQQFLKGDS